MALDPLSILGIVAAPFIAWFVLRAALQIAKGMLQAIGRGMRSILLALWHATPFPRRIDAFRIRREEKRVDRLTTRAATLSDSDDHDMVELARQGFVRVTTEGLNITGVHVTVESQINKPVRMVMPAGTQFVSDGAHQNMVSSHPVRIDLAPRQKVSHTSGRLTTSKGLSAAR